MEVVVLPRHSDDVEGERQLYSYSPTTITVSVDGGEGSGGKKGGKVAALAPPPPSQPPPSASSKGSSLTFQAQAVYRDSPSGEALFAAHVAGPLDRLLSGESCAVVAYGESGSGKSHTLFSTGGLVERSLKGLEEAGRALSTKGHTVQLSLSVFEVYDERVTDLLDVDIGAPHGSSVACLVSDEVYPGSFHGSGLTLHAFESSGEAGALVDDALTTLTLRQTAYGLDPRLSFLFVSVLVQVTRSGDKKGKGSVALGRLTFVDCAASNRPTLSLKEDPDRLEGDLRVYRTLDGLTERLATRTGGDFCAGMAVLAPFLASDGPVACVFVAHVLTSVVAAEETIRTLRYAQAAAALHLEPLPLVFSTTQKVEETFQRRVVELSGSEQGLSSLARQSTSQRSACVSAFLTWTLTANDVRLQETLVRSQRRKKALSSFGLESTRHSGDSPYVLLPYLSLLTADPLLSSVLCVHVPAVVTPWDETKAVSVLESTASLRLCGPLIVLSHCTFQSGSPYSIVVSDIHGSLRVNGRLIPPSSAPLTLGAHDRVTVGDQWIFVVVVPGGQEWGGSLDLDWMCAWRAVAELAGHMELMERMEEELLVEEEAREATMKQRLQELTASYETLKVSIQSEIDAAHEAYDRAMEELDGDSSLSAVARVQREDAALDELEEAQRAADMRLARLGVDVSVRSKELAVFRRSMIDKAGNKARLCDVLCRVEAAAAWGNALLAAPPLNRSARFQVTVGTRIIDDTSGGSGGEGAAADGGQMEKGQKHDVDGHRSLIKSLKQICCEVRLVEGPDMSGELVAVWCAEKFVSRLHLLRSYHLGGWHEWAGSEASPDDRAMSPLYDPKAHHHIGRATVYLDGLALGVDIEVEAAVVDGQGGPKARLHVSVLPVFEGEEDLEGEAMIGHPLTLAFRLTGGRLSSSTVVTRRLFAQFKMFTDGTVYTTDESLADRQTGAFVFKFDKTIHIPHVTPALLRVLQHSALSIDLYEHSGEEGAGVGGRLSRMDEVSRNTGPDSGFGRRRAFSLSHSNVGVDVRALAAIVHMRAVAQKRLAAKEAAVLTATPAPLRPPGKTTGGSSSSKGGSPQGVAMTSVVPGPGRGSGKAGGDGGILPIAQPVIDGSHDSGSGSERPSHAKSGGGGCGCSVS